MVFCFSQLFVLHTELHDKRCFAKQNLSLLKISLFENRYVPHALAIPRRVHLPGLVWGGWGVGKLLPAALFVKSKGAIHSNHFFKDQEELKELMTLFKTNKE